MSQLPPVKSKRLPRFVQEYCRHRNGTRAARDAGWPASWAHVAASMLLKEPEVQAMIAEQDALVAQEAKVEAADILREWLDVATADPSKLIHVRRVNCRYCWGKGFRYSWKSREYAEACDAEIRAAAREKREPQLPDCSGGLSFSRIAEPNPDCPECEGEGVEDVSVADLALLAGPERKLFAGVKVTKDGIEVKMRDQDKARDNLAKYLGLLVERRELTGKDGEALMPTSIIVCGPDE